MIKMQARKNNFIKSAFLETLQLFLPSFPLFLPDIFQKTFSDTLGVSQCVGVSAAESKGSMGAELRALVRVPGLLPVFALSHWMLSLASPQVKLWQPNSIRLQNPEQAFGCGREEL